MSAWAAVLCVLPSSLWRVAVGLGVPLGWSPARLELERIPGDGTLYVLALSVASIAAAALTLGLIYPWGERVPGWVPLLGGRRLPVGLVSSLAIGGALVIAGIVVLSIVNWSSVSGFRDRPWSAGAVFMVACYAPAILWAPLVLATTSAYLRRRARRP